MIGVAGDVTERRRREEALAFLDEAGEALAGSIDPVRTLEEIARPAVPRLADRCAVQLGSGEHGHFEHIAVAHVDPCQGARGAPPAGPLPAGSRHPDRRPRGDRSGRSELIPIDEELLQRGARDEAHLEILRRLRMSSAMVVPLTAQ
jgi:hypothetical protein